MPLSGEHLERAAARYERRDPRLHEELRRKFSGAGADLVEHAKRSMRISEEVALTTERGEPTGPGVVLTETIVKANARPVLVIRDNQATTEFLGPDSQVWAQRIVDAQSILDRVIPSVGRVELKNNPDYQWVGTGWIVAPDIMVTNRHVAREFARLGPQGFAFRLGLNQAPQEARIDFLEEFQRSASLEYSMESILWISDPNQADVAFLRVKHSATDRDLPAPIKLADSVTPDDLVAAIGYPARDPRVPDQEMVRRIFGDVYEKKRLAPGQIMEVKDDDLEHDCSTLGGNSGSAVVSLATGEAVGLHYSGLFMEANFAVPAPKVRELLVKAQKGELPGMAPISISTLPSAQSPAQPQTPVTSTSGTFSLQFNIPIEVTIKVGTPQPINAASTPIVVSSSVPAIPVAASDANETVLAAARQQLANVPDILDIRLGYRFKN